MKNLQIKKQDSNLDVAIAPWIPLNEMIIAQLKNELNTEYYSYQKLSLNLEGNNFINLQQIYIDLFNFITYFVNLEQLDLIFGYCNQIDQDSLKILLQCISTFAKLKKLCIHFDFQVVNVDQFQLKEFNNFNQISHKTPKISEFSLVIDKDNKFQIWKNISIIKLFTFNQTQIQNLRLEIKLNSLDNNQFLGIIDELDQLKNLEQIYFSLKENQEALDIFLLIKKLFQKNLNYLTLIFEKIEQIEIQSNIFEPNDKIKQFTKDISLTFIEASNISAIIKQILTNLDYFVNLDKFNLQIDKCNSLNNLEMPISCCLNESSTLKTFSIDLQNTHISQSLLEYVNDIQLKVFIQTQNIVLHQEQYKIQIQGQDQKLKSFKFNYDCFKNEQFQYQIQQSKNMFNKYQLNLKKLKLEVLTDNQYTFVGNGSIIEELEIKQQPSKQNLDNLVTLLNLIDNNQLKSLTLSFYPLFSLQQFDTDQLQLTLMKQKGLNYVDYDFMNIKLNLGYLFLAFSDRTINQIQSSSLKLMIEDEFQEDILIQYLQIQSINKDEFESVELVIDTSLNSFCLSTKYKNIKQGYLQLTYKLQIVSIFMSFIEQLHNVQNNFDLDIKILESDYKIHLKMKGDQLKNRNSLQFVNLKEESQNRIPFEQLNLNQANKIELNQYFNINNLHGLNRIQVCSLTIDQYIAIKPWALIDQTLIAQVKQQLNAEYYSYQNLRLNLEGSNINCQSKFIDLLNLITQFSNIEQLDLLFGYSNVIEQDSLQVLLKIIFSFAKLKKLCIHIDFQVINVKDFQLDEFYCLSQLSNQIPIISEFEIVIDRENEFQIGKNINLINFFTFNQRQIQNLRLEIKLNSFNSDQFHCIIEEIDKLKNLEIIYFSMKDNKEALDISLFIKKLFLKNLNQLTLMFEKIEQSNVQTIIIEDNNKIKYLPKDISLILVEVGNISNIIKQIFTNLDQFVNLEKFNIQIDKNNSLNSLEMPFSSCLNESSILKVFSINLQNTHISHSFLEYINDILLKVFIQTQNLVLHQEKYKILIEGFDQKLKSFKFNYDCFKNEQFQDQILQSKNLFIKQKLNLKKLKLEVLTDNQYAFVENGSIIEEMEIKYQPSQQNLDNLAIFLSLVDNSYLKSLTLSSYPLFKLIQLDTKQLQMALIKKNQLNYIDYDFMNIKQNLNILFPAIADRMVNQIQFSRLKFEIENQFQEDVFIFNLQTKFINKDELENFSIDIITRLNSFCLSVIYKSGKQIYLQLTYKQQIVSIFTSVLKQLCHVKTNFNLDLKICELDYSIDLTMKGDELKSEKSRAFFDLEEKKQNRLPFYQLNVNNANNIELNEYFNINDLNGLMPIQHTSSIAATLSSQISREAQIFPTFASTLNNFVAKVFSGIINIQPGHTYSLVNFDLLLLQQEDQVLSSIIDVNPNLINNWQNFKSLYLNELDENTKQFLLNIYQYSILQRSFQHDNDIYISDRKIIFNNIFYATKQQNILINSKNNTILESFLSEKCLNKNENSNYPYCQSWFQNTISQAYIQFFPPKMIKVTNSSQIGQLYCQELYYHSYLADSNNNQIILCAQTLITQFKNYFNNLGNYSQQAYLIDSSSQIVLQHQYKNISYNNFDDFYQEVFKYVNDSSQAQELNIYIQNYLQNLTCIQNRYYLDQKIQFCQQQINFTVNSTQNVLLLSPIIIQQKIQISNQNNQINSDQQIPYLIISFLSENDFKTWENSLNQTLDMYFIIFSICLSVITIPLSLFVYAYLLCHFIVIDDQVDRLIDILKEMATHKFNNDIISNNTEDSFFCYETKLLYQSFQAIYQILLYTSENIFDVNDTETLIKLSSHIKFFKEFCNIHAEGITYNNIATLLMAKGHLFESLEYFVQSIVCARYEIQHFCKENPYSFSAFLISEFGYSDNMQEIVSEQNNRFSIKIVKEKKKSSVTKYSSQKTVNSSANRIKKQATTHSQSTQIDPNLLEKQKLYYEFLKQNNAIEQATSFDESKDELKEQRIYLLQNLYSRNRNLIISLLLINAFYKGSYNFWNEVIEQLDLCTRISEYLPQKDLLLYEVLTVRYKALSEQKKIKKLDFVEKQIENIIQNHKIQKEQLLQSNFFKNSKQQQQELVNQIKQFHESTTSFIISNSPIYKYKDQSPIKRSQISSSEKKKTLIIQKSINLNKIETPKEQSQQIYNQNNSIYQFIIKLNDTKKIFLENKMLNNGFLKLNLAENDYRNYFLNKVSDVILYCKQYQKLEMLFDFRNNLDSAIQDYYLLENYYSLDNLNSIFTVFKSQYLAQSGQFKQAAEMLTCLFENKKQIMSHYSIKICMVLKEIFARSKIQSREFNQFFQKFDNNISMQIALIFDCQNSSELIFQSVQLFSNLTNLVLNWARDQLGIILTEQNQKIVEAFMPMMNIQQIKILQNQIIKKLMNIINGDINLLFDKLTSKIYDEICLFDDQNRQINDKGSFINQLSISQQNQFSQLAAKNNALDSIREEKLFLSQEYDHSLLSLVSEEPTIYRNNLNGMNQIGSLSNFINTKDIYQTQRNSQKNSNKKPQKLIITPKIQTHYGDESLIQSQVEDSNQQQQTIVKNDIYQLNSEHFFHISIHKALSSLFVNQIKYEQINQKLQKSSGVKFNFQYSFKQQRYIIYCTKQLCIKNNSLFLNLCQILSTLNIQVIILLQFVGNSFIEQQPDQTYIYNKIEVFRVFYHDQQIIHFLKNQRNKVNFYSFSTQIQHY
ncbi:hypothetical protein ABPG74_020554 [Tetrahymena malaccensis]